MHRFCLEILLQIFVLFHRRERFSFQGTPIMYMLDLFWLFPIVIIFSFYSFPLPESFFFTFLISILNVPCSLFFFFFLIFIHFQAYHFVFTLVNILFLSTTFLYFANSFFQLLFSCVGSGIYALWLLLIWANTVLSFLVLNK